MAEDCPENKVNMVGDGGEESVVAAHDAETLEEGCLVIGSSHSFAEIVCEGFLYIYIVHTFFFSLLHAADAPVEVSGEAIRSVV